MARHRWPIGVGRAAFESHWFRAWLIERLSDDAEFRQQRDNRAKISGLLGSTETMAYGVCRKAAFAEYNYTAASATFDAARVRVQRRIGICPTSEFGMLRDELERLSDELERTRAALDAHIREECCMVRGRTVTQD